MIRLNLEAFDVWNWRNTFRISTISNILGFNVTNGSWDTQSTWEYTMWSNDHLDTTGVVWWWVRHIALVLVNLTSTFFNSFGLILILWLVILWQHQNLVTSIDRHDSTTISHISNVADLTNNQRDNGTGSTSLNEVLFWLALLMGPFKKDFFCFCNTVFDSLLRVLWKVVIPHDQLMKLVSKIVSTCGSSVTIIHCEKGASWPFVDLLELWFDDVQDDAYSVLVVVTDDALMSISRIATHHSILLASKLGWMIWGNKSVDLLLFHFHVFLLLLVGHDEATVSNQLILWLWLCKPTVFSSILLLYFLMVRSWWLGVALFVTRGGVISCISRHSIILLSVLLWHGGASLLLLLLMVVFSRLLMMLWRTRILSISWSCSLRLVSHTWAYSQSIDTALR